MLVSTRAFVIATVKYAEADLIVTCFTEQYGLKTYLLRGVLKSRKGKLRPSLFQPLTLLQLEAFHKDKGTLERMQEAKVLKPYQTLHTNVVKTAVLLFVAEVLKYSIREEAANVPLFQFLEKVLYQLDAAQHATHFPNFFLLKLSEYLGFYPDFSNEAPYFNLLEGIFQQHPHGDFCETGEVSQALFLLHRETQETLPVLKIAKPVRLHTLEALLKYYQLHLHGFKTPKSLPVVQQLFY